jgi:hypothetical protein
MRIFAVLPRSPNAGLPDSLTWYRNLGEPLLDLGHDVVFAPLQSGIEARRTNDARKRHHFSEQLLAHFRKEHSQKHFDLFFGYFMDGMVEPAAIDEIRRSGVPCCNFSCNNIHQFSLTEKLAPHFDCNLHSERAARQKFLDIGATPLWWPMAANPRYFRPCELSRTVPVSFLGANYALRSRYVLALLHEGVDVHVYGPGWLGGARNGLRSRLLRYLLLARALAAGKNDEYRASAKLAEHDLRRLLFARFPDHLQGPLNDDQAIRLYSRSELVLGFVEVHENHDPSLPLRRHIHLREFEVPMCRAAYCTGYVEELAELYDLDKEVIIYRSEDELVDRTKFYLSRPELLESVRAAGYRRALACHTYHKRYEDLFARIGLSQEQRICIPQSR